MRIQYQNNHQGAETEVCRTERGECSEDLTLVLAIHANTLNQSVVPEEAIQRRINTLDNQDNTYFVKGAEMAIVQAEANGYEMPPFDPANYPIIDWVRYVFCIRRTLLT